MARTNVRFSHANKAKSLINNEYLSDIAFLVGSDEDKKMIYAHKLMLEMSSPVFEAMFVGSLPERNDVVQIPDITSAAFLNIIRYIYGAEMKFDWHDLFDTFIAGQKYMVYDLREAIRDCIAINLNTENKVLIYDQLVKIKFIDESIFESLLKSVRSSIDKSAFTNRYFNQISEHTLIDILEISILDIEEVVILKSCINWVDKSSSTIENKKAAFKSVVPYINFFEIPFDSIKEIKKLDSYLESTEIANLFLYLVDRKSRPYPFKIKTSRKRLLSVSCMTAFKRSHDTPGDGLNIRIFRTELLVDHEILIKSIETSLPLNLQNFEFKVCLGANELVPVFSKSSKNKKLVLDFIDSKLNVYCISIRANLRYTLVFSFKQVYMANAKISSRTETLFDNETNSIKFNHSPAPHCIEKINFCVVK